MAKYRIMVVDDEPDVRFVVTSMLAAEYETVEANNGLDALEKFDRAQPDLLLMDISMPVMNGIACCQAIHRLPDVDPPPVVFLSTATSGEIRKTALSVGAVDFIDKPFNIADLMATIKRHLSDSSTGPSEKALSIEEVRRLDMQPLSAFAAAEARAEQAEADDEPVEPPSASGKPHARRVFGKKAPGAASESDSGGDRVELPTPPAPDYKATAKRARQTASPPQPTGDETLPLPPAAAPPPPAPAPAPPPAPEQRESHSLPLPAMAAQPAASGPRDLLAQRRLRALGEPVQQKASKPRVLVILNEARALSTWNEALHKIAEFLPLEDPIEAIELIARYQPDIVVLPIAAPDFSGVEVATLLRDSTRLSHIEIVFVQSGKERPGDADTCARLSRNPVLPMPLTAVRCRMAVQPIFSKGTFRVRAKALSYGAYVEEVIRGAEVERTRENKEKTKQALHDNYTSLRQFMARELKDYKEPQAARE